MVSVTSDVSDAQPVAAATLTNGHHPRHAHNPSTFVSRVTSIPMVVEAYTTVNNAVHTLAEKNRYIHSAFDSASVAVHSVVITASRYAEPYQQRFGPHITKVDETASKVLDVVEEKFPIITKPCAQVLSNARGAVSQVKTTVVSSKPVASASHAVKDLEAALASVLDNLEGTLDKYLPEETKRNGEAADANGHSNGTDGQVKRAVHLSFDVQRRLARKVIAQIKNLQANIPEASHELIKLKESSHLLTAATQSLRSLNEKLTPLVAYLQGNANALKESGVERAKALDAQFEIRERLEPVIKTYLTEISALTAYVQAHVPAIKITRSAQSADSAPAIVRASASSDPAEVTAPESSQQA